MLIDAPAAAKHRISDEPPADTNGNGTPMTGMMPTTTAMFTSACPTIHSVKHNSAMDV